jgi:hypothetical protein
VIFIWFLKGQSDPRPGLQELQGPGATLNGKEICEASHRAMFLTISLRGKDGTPWQGVAYTRVIVQKIETQVKPMSFF